jgi:PPIC-type PPIASE domain
VIRAPWRALACEPIFHFAVASGLIFAVYALLAPPEKPVIRVDEATVEGLMRERGGILLRPLTPQDRQDVVETYIGEEILLREAYKRGLDRTPRIRAQLVQLMRHALAPETSRPSETDLRRFFEENRARFERPAAISLVQVLVANGKPVPDGLIERLNAGANPGEVGDFDMGLGSTIRRASADNLAGLFGRAAASNIVAIADDRWHGPFHSARGLHFVRISERHPPEIPAFEKVATYVEEDWELARQSEVVARALKVLGREYVVVRPAPDKR